MTTPTRVGLSSAPLGAVLAYTFLNSIGNAVLYTGVFALAEQLYGFDKWHNFLLAIVWGVAYIPGALAAGPIVRYAGRRATALSPRGVLLAIMAGMIAVALLPVLTAPDAAAAVPGETAKGAWAIWVAVGVYGVLSGIHWPIVESYISGGRAGHDLQAATGKFNIAWSSSLVFAMLAMGPFLKDHSLGILGAMALIHLAALVLAKVTFPAYPGKHGPAAEHADGPTPASYKDLLVVFRLLLPASFIVNAAFAPYLPSAVKALGLGVAWKTALAAAWMGPRVLTFLVLERRRGWHGSWSMPVIGGVILLAGFAGAVLAPGLGATPLARAVMVGGLALFGVGLGTIYTGALYYAMEAGSAEVDAGGTHEALIGMGYSIGPICGVVGILAADAGGVWSGQDEVVMLVLASLGAVSLATVAAWRVVGKARSGRTTRAMG